MSNDRLKFRAWDKWRKQMIHPKGGDFIGWHAMSNWRDCLEVMQWTGLYDSEGVEIYEGDIVRAFDNINRISDPSLTERGPTYNHKAVKYMGGAFVLYSAEYDFCGVLGYNSATKPETLTVAGNIYESPDLMERANG